MWISGVPWQALNPQTHEWLIVIHMPLSFLAGNVMALENDYLNEICTHFPQIGTLKKLRMELS